MNIQVYATPQELGRAAAGQAAAVLNAAIREQGRARLVLSTGASQFPFIEAFVRQPVDWSKVEMFHLDEYVGLPESHPASFRKYLKERFAAHVPTLGRAFYVNGEGDVASRLEELSCALLERPVDLAMIGIGENAHIAFNDPPADFATTEPYIVVDLDEHCKRQQVGEGWFPTMADVPQQAVTMSVHRILQSRVILSCVPHAVKARAVRLTLEHERTEAVPATALKEHPNWTLYLDAASASEAGAWIGAAGRARG